MYSAKEILRKTKIKFNAYVNSTQNKNKIIF